MLITFHTHVTGNQQNYLSKLNVKNRLHRTKKIPVPTIHKSRYSKHIDFISFHYKI